MDLELLDKLLAERGEPPFRARQIWEWTAHGAGAYEEMTNLPASLREALAAELPFSTLSSLDEARCETHREDPVRPPIGALSRRCSCATATAPAPVWAVVSSAQTCSSSSRGSSSPGSSGAS